MEPPPRSPDRTAWAVEVAPWLMVWPRFVRAAQAGCSDEAAVAALPIPSTPAPGD